MYTPVVQRRWRPAVLAAGLCLVAALGGAVSAGPAVASPAISAAGGTWGAAKEVAGVRNAGGNAEVQSVSCASPGNCSAGGYYNAKPGHAHEEAFVVNEVNGVWGTAQRISGPAGAVDPQISSVSCGSPGDCTAGGLYFTVTKSATPNHALVVNEVNGVWGAARPVPGLAKLDVGGGGQLTSVSCTAAGDCSAGGFYVGKGNHPQSFVANEVNGTWRTAEEVPGLGQLNAGGNAELQRVSCAAPGNCAADGFYLDKSVHPQAFVADEVNGTWRTAEEVPGTAALNTGGYAVAAGLSCASPGNCGVGGDYHVTSGQERAFVASEVNGVWRRAAGLPPVAGAPNGDGISSISCASPGNCGATGNSNTHPFVVTQTHGTWGTAREIPVTALNTVSCASAGNCSAGGWESVQEIHSQGIVLSEVNGTWGAVEVLPGLAKLNAGLSASVNGVSCASPGHCAAGGNYSDKSDNVEAFVASES